MRNILIFLTMCLAACSDTVSGSLKATPNAPKQAFKLPPATYLVQQNGQCLTVDNQKLQLSPCNGEANQQFKLRSDNAWVINHRCLAMNGEQAVTQPCKLPTEHGFGLGRNRFVHHQSGLCAQSSGKKIVWRKCEESKATQDFEYY